MPPSGERPSFPALDYQAPAARTRSRAAAVLLVALPVFAAAFVFASWVHWLQEPFFAVDATDVVLFGGAPAVCVVAGMAWCVLAVRRPRLEWGVILLVLFGFIMLATWSAASLQEFFDEPWKTGAP